MGYWFEDKNIEENKNSRIIEFRRRNQGFVFLLIGIILGILASILQLVGGSQLDIIGFVPVDNISDIGGVILVLYIISVTAIVYGLTFTYNKELYEFDIENNHLRILIRSFTPKEYWISLDQVENFEVKQVQDENNEVHKKYYNLVVELKDKDAIRLLSNQERDFIESRKTLVNEQLAKIRS